MKESKTTIDDLIQTMNGLAKTVDDLARITKNGFDDMGKRFNERFDEVEEGMGKQNQTLEDIKLRLGNVAYRFELQELERRVTLLEKSAKFS